MPVDTRICVDRVEVVEIVQIIEPEFSPDRIIPAFSICQLTLLTQENELAR